MDSGWVSIRSAQHMPSNHRMPSAHHVPFIDHMPFTQAFSGECRSKSGRTPSFTVTIHLTTDPPRGEVGEPPRRGGLRPKPPGVLMLPRWRTPHQRGPARGNDGACRIVYRFFCIIPPCRACHRLFSQAGLTMSPAWGVSKTNSTAKSIENSGRNTSACAKTKENISKMTSVAKTI